MSNPLISVIVPVYNVEEYIRECVDSILMQTMKDYEVILVNDGSKDRSGVICEEYSDKYENVRTYNKENGGASDARNLGIKCAVGDYILFIDSDDYYDDCNFFEKIKTAIVNYNHPTMICFSNKAYYPSTGKVAKGKYLQNTETVNSIESYEDIIEYLVENDSLSISASLKVIKRTHLIENSLFFKKGIVTEDIEWSMRLYSKPFTMKWIESDAYIYRKERVGSVTNSMSAKSFSDYVEILDEYSKAFLSTNNTIDEYLLNYLAYQYCILCGLFVRLKGKEDRKKIYSFIKQSKWLLHHNMSPKVKKVQKLYKFVGIKCTVYLLGFYINHRG